MSWTAEMVAVVKQHWGNKSAREIGDMIDRNRNAVIGKAHRLGLTINVISNGRRNRLDHSGGDKPSFQSPDTTNVNGWKTSRAIGTSAWRRQQKGRRIARLIVGDASLAIGRRERPRDG